MSFSFAMAQKTDPLLTDIRDQYGMDYLKDFGIDGALGTVQLKSYKGSSSDYAEISKSVASLLDNSPIPPFIGSNSWVIGAPKTKNEKVIFANDPHIGFHNRVLGMKLILLLQIMKCTVIILPEHRFHY